jgi:hypothetical protein
MDSAIDDTLFSPDLGKIVAKRFLQAYPFYAFTRSFS